MTRHLPIALRITLILSIALAMAGATRLHRAPWSTDDVARMAQAQIFGASAVICDVGGHSSGNTHDTRCDACQVFASAVLPPIAVLSGWQVVAGTSAVDTATRADHRPALRGPPLPARGPPTRLS